MIFDFMGFSPMRNNIKIGTAVKIIQKKIRVQGNSEGIVKKIISPKNFHPHGIKVELLDGKIGRVQNILN